MFPSQESQNVPQTQHNSYISPQRVAQQVQKWAEHLSSWWTELSLTAFEAIVFVNFFSSRLGSGRPAGRSAADWVTALKSNRRCLIWQPLSVCVHEGARQIQLRSHKNTLHVSVCLSQSLTYFGFTPSARICFYPRHIKPFLCFSSGICPPRSFLSFHLQILKFHINHCVALWHLPPKKQIDFSLHLFGHVALSPPFFFLAFKYFLFLFLSLVCFFSVTRSILVYPLLSRCTIIQFNHCQPSQRYPPLFVVFFYISKVQFVKMKIVEARS